MAWRAKADDWRGCRSECAVCQGGPLPIERIGRNDWSNQMREIQASEAKTHLPSILDAVERGETVIITRHGRAIARLVPEHDRRQEEVDQAMTEIEAIRRRSKGATRKEIRAWINQGRA